MDTDSQLFEVKKAVNTSWVFAKKTKTQPKDIQP